MTAVEVLKPLVAEAVPAGSVTSRVPPTIVVMAPTERESGLAVALAVRVMALAPVPTVRPLKVWAFVLLALPSIARVDPLARARADRGVPVMDVPLAMTAVEATLIVKLVPAWKLAMVAFAGTLVPVIGMPTYQPAVMPV